MSMQEGRESNGVCFAGGRITDSKLGKKQIKFQGFLQTIKK